mmetsp:Transcript_99974/g.278430  ORF Transcript_99974/g.278430 Transcript_99974/m.278430 type:complete len:481 (-) Transcript_99974:12-1454(-)
MGKAHLDGVQVRTISAHKAKVVNQHFGPNACLGILYLDVHCLASAAGKVGARGFEERVGVRRALRGAQEPAVVPAAQVETRSPVRAASTLEAEAVDVGGEKENRGDSDACRLVASQAQILGPVHSGHAGVSARPRLHVDITDLCTSHTRPARGTAALGGFLERDGEPDLGGQAHPQVADHGNARVLSSTTLVSAGRHVQPAHVLRRVTPIGDAQGHALRHGLGQVGENALAIGMVDDDLAPLLLQHCLRAGEARGGPHGGLALLAAPMERRDDMEGPRRVNAEAGPWTIEVRAHVLGVLPTAVAVATAVMPRLVGCVAPVGRGLECVGVSLHDVDFRAERAAHLVGVAVIWAPRATSCTEVPRHILGGRLYEVKRHVASTTNAAKVDGEAEGPPEELQLLEAIRPPGVAALRRHEAHAGVVPERHVAAVRVHAVAPPMHGVDDATDNGGPPSTASSGWCRDGHENTRDRAQHAGPWTNQI